MARNIFKTEIKPTNLKLDYITLLLKCRQWLLITFSIKSIFPTMTCKALCDLASAYFANLISYHFLLCPLTSFIVAFFPFLKHGNLFLSILTGFSKTSLIVGTEVCPLSISVKPLTLLYLHSL